MRQQIHDLVADVFSDEEEEEGIDGDGSLTSYGSGPLTPLPHVRPPPPSTAAPDAAPAAERPRTGSPSREGGGRPSRGQSLLKKETKRDEKEAAESKKRWGVLKSAMKETPVDELTAGLDGLGGDGSAGAGAGAGASAGASGPPSASPSRPASTRESVQTRVIELEKKANRHAHGEFTSPPILQLILYYHF